MAAIAVHLVPLLTSDPASALDCASRWNDAGS